ncbi:hypothetical protein KC19_11G166300 [Ceratodon purpureus]|uniref:Uncharacterized protein n=1 Tax=Ceratodon purpureus TaxID=3225 RepID=A0A8T0GH99_CERPU|nr:hypothetical protein KC19_11G166300 [Ceratodon purpureus]
MQIGCKSIVRGPRRIAHKEVTGEVLSKNSAVVVVAGAHSSSTVKARTPWRLRVSHKLRHNDPTTVASRRENWIPEAPSSPALPRSKAGQCPSPSLPVTAPQYHILSRPRIRF